jgi:predicted  nucleic acid-binding Zn-ribbon protein
MSLSAGEIVRLLKSDRDALRELAVAVASEPELRLAVINAVLADVATKQDINQLRQEMRGEITSTKQEIQQLRQELRGEIAQLRQHVDSEIAQLRQEMKDEISQLRRDMSTNFRWTIGLIIGIWGTTVIPLLMKMAGII